MLNRCPMCLFKELRCRPQYLCKGNVHVVFMHDGCHIRDMIYSLLKHHARCFLRVRVLCFVGQSLIGIVVFCLFACPFILTIAFSIFLDLRLLITPLVT